jgi:hypothetical protein
VKEKEIYMRNIPQNHRKGIFTPPPKNWAYPKIVERNWEYPKNEDFPSPLYEGINEEKNKEKDDTSASGGRILEMDCMSFLGIGGSIFYIFAGTYSLGEYFNSKILEYYGSYENLKIEIIGGTEKTIKKNMEENPQFREELGFPPIYEFSDNAMEAIKREDERGRRITKLEEMGGFDINREMEKRRRIKKKDI